MGQEQRVPCFPVNTVQDLLSDEHLAHRGFFVEMEHPVAGVLQVPGGSLQVLKLPTTPDGTARAPVGRAQPRNSGQLGVDHE